VQIDQAALLNPANLERLDEAESGCSEALCSGSAARFKCCSGSSG
jgi:hypothetical protein